MLAEWLREQLARARAEGRTLYRVAKAAGVGLPQLSRFAAGKGSLSMEAAGRVVAALGCLPGAPTPSKPDRAEVGPVVPPSNDSAPRWRVEARQADGPPKPLGTVEAPSRAVAQRRARAEWPRINPGAFVLTPLSA